MKEIVKEYPWYEPMKAMEESGKSLAELFDFKTGTLIWYRNKSTNGVHPPFTHTTPGWLSTS